MYHRDPISTKCINYNSIFPLITQGDPEGLRRFAKQRPVTNKAFEARITT